MFHEVDGQKTVEKLREDLRLKEEKLRDEKTQEVRTCFFILKSGEKLDA